MIRVALAGIVLAGIAGPANAFVVEGPPIVAACRSGATWADVNTCLARQGDTTVEGTLPKAKLVRVVQNVEKQRVDQGVYLYVQRADGSWSIGGIYQGRGYTVRGLARQTIASYVGYRISLGGLVHQRLLIRGGIRRAIQQTQIEVFCDGRSASCTQVITHCDLLVHGRAIETYRGALSFTPSSILARGDRTLAGGSCQTTPRIDHHWPIPPPPPVAN